MADADGSKLTDLPAIPGTGLDPQVKHALDKLREAVQVLRANRGDPLDAAITWRGALARGLATLRGSLGQIGSGSGTLGPPDPVDTPPDLTPPPTVTGLTAEAAISHVIVKFDAPTYTQGHGNQRTDIYAVQKDPDDPALPTFTDAAVVTSAAGASPIVAISSNPHTRWHIWAKYVTVDGVASTEPAGGTNGVIVTTGEDVATLLAALDGQITESQLYADLGARIDLIDGAAGVPGSVNARIATEAQSRTDGDSALASSITQLTTTVGDNTTTLEEQAQSLDGLSAQYTVKIDNNGYVSGFGLASTPVNGTPYSSFIVRADEFSIAAPSGPGIDPIVPFTVITTPTTINGVPVPVGVYMDAAYILNGTITSAQIGQAEIDDANIANLSAAKLTAGAIDAGEYVESTGFVSGSSGWRIAGNGTAEFAGVIVRGTIYATTGAIGGADIGTTYVESPNFNATTHAGWQLNSSTGKITAASVLIVDSTGTRLFNTDATGSAPVLQIGTAIQILADGTATFGGTLTAASVVDTSQLKANAATQLATANAGAQVFGASATAATLLTSAPFVSTGAPIIVQVNTSYGFSINLGDDSSGSPPPTATGSVDVTVYMDGTAIWSDSNLGSRTGMDFNRDTHQDYSRNISASVLVAPGAGSHTFSVAWARSGSAAGGAGGAASSSPVPFTPTALMMLEVKR